MWDSRGGNLSSLLVQSVDEGHQEKVSLLKRAERRRNEEKGS